MGRIGLFSVAMMTFFLMYGMGGCKPENEPEYPYARKPLDRVQSISPAQSEKPDATRAGAPSTEARVEDSSPSVRVEEVEGEPEDKPEAGTAEVTELKGESTSVAEVPEKGAASAENEVPVEEEIPAERKIASFHGARDKRLRAVVDAGLHEYRFRPSGFFDYRFFGRDDSQLSRRGTYRLSGENLEILFTETRTSPGDDPSRPKVEIVRGKSEVLSVSIPGDGSLHLDDLRFVFIP